MFRHNSSSRLSRSKSTSSVHSKHESIDPQVARQHAHVAATLAFARAQERSSTDQCYSRNSNTSRNNAPERQSYHQLTDHSTDGEHVIRRQQSVRFVGPHAVQNRQTTTSNRTSQQSIQPRTSTATLRPIAMTTSAPVPAAYRPPSRCSSLGKTSSDKPATENFATALAAYDEYYTREPELASTPSSDRRLRKSKSMFSPNKAPNVYYSNGTPNRQNSLTLGRQNSIAESHTPQSQHFQPSLRAPKSLNFHHGGRGFRQRNDEAVQMARDRFFHQAKQERLREQPSFLFRSRVQKADRPFRKSVRSSSGNSDPLPVASSNQDYVPKDSKIIRRARKASQTLKIRLKKVFGLTKDEPITIPNQQVDARETHVRQYSCGPSGEGDTFADIPYPDDHSLSRVASREPSLRRASSREQLQSRTGSVRSARSLKSRPSDDGSRVTSWTSTTVNTLNSQVMRGLTERENHRLSIINEIGTHKSSTSFRRGGVQNQYSAHPIVPPSSRPTSRGSSRALNQLNSPVDSARVYSALMKRLDENKPKTNHQVSKKSSAESFQTLRVSPTRNESSNRGRDHKYATIRHVPQEDGVVEAEGMDISNHAHEWANANTVHATRAENVFGITDSHVHQWMLADPLGRMRSEDQQPVVEQVPTMSQRDRAKSNTSTSTISSQQQSTRASFYAVPRDNGRSPQEIALENEPVVIEPKRLRESRSTFFGGTTITASRATSPYRRAKAADAGQDIDEHASNAADSVSLYSRTTSGHTVAANSALSLLIDGHHQNSDDLSCHNSSTGDVIILDRAVYRASMPGGRTHRVSTSAGSNEWKSWMSSEVAKLERSRGSKHHQYYVNYALPTMPNSFHGRHVRESAQYDDERLDISERQAIAVNLPLGMVQQPNIIAANIPYLKPILKKPSQVSLGENNDPRNGSSSTIHVPPPPPIPGRSPLRATQSRTSFRSNSTTQASNSAVKISSMNGRNVLHKKHTSKSTLHSVKSFQSFETPAKLVKKHGRLTRVTPDSTPNGGLNAAVERQFGSLSTNYQTPAQYNENFYCQATQESEDPYGVDGTGLMGPDIGDDMGELSERDAQAMGSRKMVELFLSSRRRRIAGGASEEDGDVFL
ncbi:hypothetical protein BJ875DRAFT_516353 [Amylocarpus encephaloides]|uniref:Uncharacterized protein n=1 Tax=Amylocarpus encephaloides TaxID=45428 RepID=A0A9P8C905_9HELO|nr:hypothetical protein BJ875DRAFT_516353 [Amylocarpus encephaloides]